MSKRIALIGLDGCGKTSNIEKLQLDPAFSNYKFIWARWKPTLLKPIYLLMGKKISRDSRSVGIGVSADGEAGSRQVELTADYNAKANLKDRVFRNPVIRQIWMFLALVDYFFQFHIKVLPHIFSGKGIIFDRFFLDLFVDQGINLGYAPEKIREEIKKHQFLFPKVNRYIYICVSPEICYHRISDIPSYDYLTKRFQIYECLAQDDSWISVDGQLPLDDVSAQIKKLILE